MNIYISLRNPLLPNLYRAGRVAGVAASVLSVLRFRGIEVPLGRERQIEACTDLAQLDLWLQRAVHATHIDDVFDDASGAGSRV